MIPLWPTALALRQAAAQLAETFQLPLLETLPPTLPPLLLQLTPERLELCDPHCQMGPVYVDFLRGNLGYRRHHGGGRKQALGKAIGLKPKVTPSVVDATAGLGRDAFMLAWLGCRVQMLERSPVVAALLYDGLRRAQQDLEIGSLVTERLHLIYQDAQTWLANQRPEVIYLDPMYPHRKKSALVKKEMRIFRLVVGDDLDALSLLQIAFQQARQRVVVKRPKLARPLGVPTFAIQSENTRFDVYLKGTTERNV